MGPAGQPPILLPLRQVITLHKTRVNNIGVKSCLLPCASNPPLILNCVQWYIDDPFEPCESGDPDRIFFQGAQGILKDLFHGA